MAKNILAKKDYPHQYPHDAVEVLNAMSFSKGENLQIVGSASLRSQQYSGDYDAFEIVKANTSEASALKHFVAEFKRIIRQLQGMKNVFIGDIKSGEIPEWKAETKKKIDELRHGKIITDAEAEDAKRIIKDKPSKIESILIKNTVKFHIVRWTTQQILKGKQTLRDGRIYTLEQAFASPSLTKLDVVALIQDKYTDLSCIYEFVNQGRVLNPDKLDPKQSLLDSIAFYEHEGNRYKVIKRKFSLAKLLDEKANIIKYNDILNSEAGKLYVVFSDVKTLADLLDSHSLPKEKLNYAVNGFKHRLARIYHNEHYLKQEKKLLAELDKAVKSKHPSKELRKIEKYLFDALNYATKLKGGYAPII